MTHDAFLSLTILNRSIENCIATVWCTEVRIPRLLFFQHAYFDSDSLYYDIAMIKLAHSPNLNLNVNTVAMASSGNDIDSDTSCYITGWGKTVGKFAVLLFEPAREIMVLIT